MKFQQSLPERAEALYLHSYIYIMKYRKRKSSEMVVLHPFFPKGLRDVT